MQPQYNQTPEYKYTKTRDPLAVFRSVARQNCNKMHCLADMMQSIIDMKKMKEFTSARTPECLDVMMEQLVYILHCEANCGVDLPSYLASGGDVEVIDYDAMQENN